jgi:hypothetical protein
VHGPNIIYVIFTLFALIPTREACMDENLLSYSCICCTRRNARVAYSIAVMAPQPMYVLDRV